MQIRLNIFSKVIPAASIQSIQHCRSTWHERATRPTWSASGTSAPARRSTTPTTGASTTSTACWAVASTITPNSAAVGGTTSGGTGCQSLTTQHTQPTCWMPRLLGLSSGMWRARRRRSPSFSSCRIRRPMIPYRPQRSTRRCAATSAPIDAGLLRRIKHKLQ